VTGQKWAWAQPTNKKGKVGRLGVLVLFGGWGVGGVWGGVGVWGGRGMWDGRGGEGGKCIKMNESWERVCGESGGGGSAGYWGHIYWTLR